MKSFNAKFFSFVLLSSVALGCGEAPSEPETSAEDLLRQQSSGKGDQASGPVEIVDGEIDKVLLSGEVASQLRGLLEESLATERIPVERGDDYLATAGVMCLDRGGCVVEGLDAQTTEELYGLYQSVRLDNAPTFNSADAQGCFSLQRLLQADPDTLEFATEGAVERRHGAFTVTSTDHGERIYCSIEYGEALAMENPHPNIYHMQRTSQLFLTGPLAVELGELARRAGEPACDVSGPSAQCALGATADLPLASDIEPELDDFDDRYLEGSVGEYEEGAANELLWSVLMADSCGDGSALECRALAPTCADGETLTVVDNCWACRGTDSCSVSISQGDATTTVESGSFSCTRMDRAPDADLINCTIAVTSGTASE